MKQRILLLSFVMGMVLMAQAQTRTLTGKVTGADDGAALPGVNVSIKGTSTGTITDIDGNYKAEVSDSDVLVFSYIGYETQELTVGSQTVADISLAPVTEQLDEVVVTALGISREKKSLTYSAQEVSGEEMTRAKDASFINALAGKTPGVQINRSGSGVGGSTKVILRGNSSTRDNNVLYVIDGVPMSNYSPSQPTDVWGSSAGPGSSTNGAAGRDGGDAISNLNPEDIESMTVLKGASAAALYGSQAANGVIMITTKQGSKGKTSVAFSSNFTIENPLILPEFQNRYGSGGQEVSWGAAEASNDHVKDYFETGKTWINSVSLSGGNDVAQSYFSYAHTNSKGMIPGSEFNKHNISFKESASFFNDKLKVTGGVNIISQKARNRATSGMYSNPLVGLYIFPRSNDISDAKNFEVWDNERLLMTQNWHSTLDMNQNPYWLNNRVLSTDTRNRAIANATIEYGITDELKVRVKGTLDHTNDRYNQNSYAGTNAVLSDRNGRYYYNTTKNVQTYGEAVLSYNKTLEKVSVSALLGTAINDVRRDADLLDSKGAGSKPWGHVYGLQYANVFSLQNIAQPGATMQQTANYSQLQAIFGSVNVGYNGMVFLDVTGRNDWSSTLAFTDNFSFFYPSVGLTAVLSEMVDLPSAFDLLKVRGSYATVGNGVSPYDTQILNPISGSGFAPPVAIVPDSLSLKPESQTSLEAGLELGMFNRRLNVNFTYYDNTTKDQRITIDAPSGAGYAQYIVNAGEISNKGIELGITATPISSNDFSWDIGVNYTRNRNKVEKLHESLSDGIFMISSDDVNGYGMGLREGGSFGELYGRTFEYDDNGNITVDESGAALKVGGQKIGDINPDFLLSVSNSLTFKKIRLDFLIDGRFGGDVMSMTEAVLDEYGVSERSAAARDAGGVMIPAVVKDSDGNVSAHSGVHNPQAFYSSVGGRAGVTGNYIYSATNIRLRELSISYPLPVSSVNWLQSVTVSLVGRNLFFLKNDAPFDPDVSMGTGVGMQGVHVFAQPSARSFGVNLSVKF